MQCCKGVDTAASEMQWAGCSRLSKIPQKNGPDTRYVQYEKYPLIQTAQTLADSPLQLRPSDRLGWAQPQLPLQAVAFRLQRLHTNGHRHQSRRQLLHGSCSASHHGDGDCLDRPCDAIDGNRTVQSCLDPYALSCRAKRRQQA